MAEIGQQGRALAERFGDRSALVTIITAEAARKGVGGDTRGYYEGGLEAERLVDASVDHASRITVQLNRAYSTFCIGRMSEALPAIEALGALAGSDLRAGFEGFGFSAAGWFRHMAAWALAFRADLDGARDHLLSAIRMNRENDFKENLGWALGTVPMLARLRGMPVPGLPEPRSAALEALEIAEGLASRYSRAEATRGLALAQLATGSFAEAVQAASDALALVREHETAREYEVSVLSFRAEALTALGDAAAALPLAREAVALAAAQPSFAYGVDACCTLAQALLAGEGAAARSEVEAALAQALAWLDESGAEALRPRVLEARAALAAAVGDEAACTRDRAEALRLYRAMGAEGHVARLAAP
jgi:tetratricopeptide (TPR) repeat protein